jgi:hypothetical protein
VTRDEGNGHEEHEVEEGCWLDVEEDINLARWSSRSRGGERGGKKQKIENKHHENVKEGERKASRPTPMENGKVEKSVCLMAGRVKRIWQREKKSTINFT